MSFSITPLNLQGLACVTLLLGVGIPLALVAQRLWRYTTWLRDLDGPTTKDYFMGNWSEFQVS